MQTERQAATLEVWGGSGRGNHTNSVAGGHGNRLVKRRVSTAGKEQRHRVWFADTSSANMTRISKVKIPNSNLNINFEVRKFEVRLTSLIRA